MIRAWSLAWAVALAGCAIEYRVPDATGESESDGAAGCEVPAVQCGGDCVDTLADPEHCGECNRTCEASEVCDAGQCRSECTDGRSDCSGSCVDLTTDPLHCGRCTEQCEPGGMCVAADCIDSCNDTCDRHREVCVSGSCECRTGFVECDGACVDLTTDPAHCGTCGRDCGGDPCGASDCQPSGCGAFPDQCGQSCTDIGSDPLHCGDCGDPCEGDEVCLGGDCDDQD